MKRACLALFLVFLWVTSAGAAINDPNSIPWGQSKAEGIKAFGVDPALFHNKNAVTAPQVRNLGDKKALLVYFYGKNGLGAVGLSATRQLNPELDKKGSKAFATELSTGFDKDFGKRVFENRPFMPGITATAWRDKQGFYYLIYLDETPQVGGVHFRLMRESDFKQQFK